MNNILVSIIIVNYRTKHLTKNCVDSILNELVDISYEIIIVDNNSGDESVEFLKQEFPEIKIIANAENYGFGKANNIGVANSRGRYIFLLNSDTIIKGNIFNSFVDFFENNLHLKIGSIGSLLISNDNKLLHSYGFFPKNLKRKINLKTDLCDDDYVKNVDIVIGANMFMLKSVFDNFNGFDENIFLYEEELELQYRMKLSGFNSYIINEKKIIHLEGESSTSYFKRECSFLSLCYINNKHLSKFEYMIFRMRSILFAIVFFKNTKISLMEKFNYLKLTINRKSIYEIS